MSRIAPAVLIYKGKMVPVNTAHIYIPSATEDTITVNVQKYLFWHNDDLWMVRVALAPDSAMPAIDDLLPWAQPVDDPGDMAMYGSRLRALTIASENYGLRVPPETYARAWGTP